MTSTPPSRPPTEHTLLASTDAMVWAQEFVRIFEGQVVSDENDAVNVGLMVAWFANAIETGRSAGMGQVAVAQTNDDGSISLVTELDMGRDVRISPQLLMQMIDRHNESIWETDEESPTLEESFLEGFEEGR